MSESRAAVDTCLIEGETVLSGPIESTWYRHRFRASGDLYADSETRKWACCLRLALYARGLAEQCPGKTRHLGKRWTQQQTLRAVVLLERKIQDRRRPPAVVLREGAPLFD